MARGQKQAFGTDAVTPLDGFATKRGLDLIAQISRQKMLLAATELVYRTDTRCASAARFQR